MEDRQKSIIKMIAGATITIGGIVGLILGRSIKSVVVRVIVLIVSIIAIFSGTYLFYLGLDDYAIGILGQAKLTANPTTSEWWDYGDTVAMVAKDHKELKERLRLTKQSLKKQGLNVHRLHFKCPDDSKEFTVYLTPFGIFNIPTHDIVCDNKTKLLTYGK